ncbi:glycine betaine ABC transporter substrate-binding protein [Lacticaseibacillus hulanensis]|uniref:glycine betaine ABC transporter substrate-binding protein n=1 Tax=Lacticaseibacillus hulanensis TaxID=2493111 RepID=UPI000FDA8B12|nr:glycine betaine ABC transporter substrate-binding protein [Lacticaseibacillus hulanensis]
MHTWQKICGVAVVLLLLLPLMAGCNTGVAPYDPDKPLGRQINYTITGIDAGSGEMAATERVLKQYGLTERNWQLQASSTAAMTAQLGRMIANRQPIVVTGWQPHWMFTKYDLKFLKDPKNVYGSEEDIHTICRQGLRADEPSAYTVLDRFYWTPAQMSDVMMRVNKGASPAKAADKWLARHPKQVQQWLSGVPRVHGRKLKMTYVAWDSEIASSNVAAALLRKVGYKVVLQSMEMQPMWASIATKAADAMTCAWLPNTSSKYYHDYRSQVVDLGVNLRGAQVGLAVPKYMRDIDSINDLR